MEDCLFSSHPRAIWLSAFMVIQTDFFEVAKKVDWNSFPIFNPVPSACNMSNSGHDHGCAVHPDGMLKDALEIVWDYNPDGEMPAPASAESNVVDLHNSPSKIHPFFAGQVPPAIKLAGACCSIHTTHPSACVIDPTNLMNTAGPSLGMPSSTTPVKCKASGPVPSRHVIRKVIAEPSSDLSMLSAVVGSQTVLVATD